MSSWINLHALWQIVVIGLLAGAGLPAVFAVGLRLLNPKAELAGAESETLVTAGPAGITAAALCFAVVLAAIGWGIYFIVASS